jgi:hypothetical protein
MENISGECNCIDMDSYPDYTLLGRYMHDDGFDMGYPEQYLPADLLQRLNAKKNWREGDWWWGWDRLRATRTAAGAPKIHVANIAWGQGYHTIKSWLPDTGCFIDENTC